MYGFSSELAAGILEKVCDKPANEALKRVSRMVMGRSVGTTFTYPLGWRTYFRLAFHWGR